MAPDLNSVPPSPRPLAATASTSPLLPSTSRSRNQSRRTSQQIMPPVTSASASTSPSLNILPSNQSTVNASIASPLASPTVMPAGIGAAGIGAAGTGATMGDNTGVGMGPGPLRHPRPLTAADLHLQLEKEQEAVVNRLTRELSLLRAAQNASVVSNASSTSTGLPDSLDHNANHLLSGPSHPTPSQRRHHRSSSSTSTRSNTGLTTGVTAMSIPSTTADRTRREAPRHESVSLSRQNSMTGSVRERERERRSGASSPANVGSYNAGGEHLSYFYSGTSQRPTPHREPSSGNIITASGGHDMLRADSVTSIQTTGRYEEIAFNRHELEAVKRENEVLKRRIRELERTLRTRRQSDASAAGGEQRTRSESVSTTASVRDRERDGGVSLAGAGRGRGRESLDRDRERERERENDGEEGVLVGESARSAGVGR